MKTTTLQYTATIEVPQFSDPADLAEFITALRAFGYPRLLVTFEGDSRDEVIENVANETSIFWYKAKFTREWWDSVLSRGRRVVAS